MINFSDNLREIFVYLMIDEYNPSGIPAIIGFIGPERASLAKEELSNIIKGKKISREYYEELTGIDIETDRQLYEHLGEVWQYIFNKGPEPDIDKYIY